MNPGVVSFYVCHYSSFSVYDGKTFSFYITSIDFARRRIRLLFMAERKFFLLRLHSTLLLLLHLAVRALNKIENDTIWQFVHETFTPLLAYRKASLIKVNFRTKQNFIYFLFLFYFCAIKRVNVGGKSIENQVQQQSI